VGLYPLCIRREAQNMADDCAPDMARSCGVLRCVGCGATKTIDQASLRRYSRRGWPRCHGRTMRWHTHINSTERGWREAA
jgi:hypothetical protein